MGRKMFYKLVWQDTLLKLELNRPKRGGQGEPLSQRRLKGARLKFGQEETPHQRCLGVKNGSRRNL